jgi:hypothetical protein
MSVQFLTAVEAGSWCLKNGIPVEGRRPKPQEAGGIPSLGFSIPEDAGARTSLARMLYPNAEDGELLIWTTDWSVWPSGEHLPLMDRLREALGEKRTGLSLVVLNVLFLWDCWLISSRGEYVAFFCHDEWGELYIVQESRRSEARGFLKKWAYSLKSDDGTRRHTVVQALGHACQRLLETGARARRAQAQPNRLRVLIAHRKLRRRVQDDTARSRLRDEAIG